MITSKIIKKEHFESLLESALMMAYCDERFLYDFPRALVEVVCTNIAKGNIGWVECIGPEGHLFGPNCDKDMNITVAVKKISTSLNLIGKSLVFNFYWQAGDSKKTDSQKGPSEVQKFFEHVKQRMSEDLDKQEPILNSLVIDWFWHRNPGIKKIADDIVSTSNRAAPNKEQIKSKLDECLQNNNFKNSSSGDPVHRIAKIIREEYPLTTNRLLSNYLSSRIYSLQEIEWVRARRSENLPKSGGREENSLFEQDTLIWEFRKNYFGYFNYIFGKAYHPYFFFYDPFKRKFFYRGLLPSDFPDHKIGENFEEIERKILNAENSLGESIDQGINRKIYDAKEFLWSSNISRDFKTDETVKDLDQQLKDFEEKDLKIFGSNTSKVKMAFAPIIFHSQYRGLIFYRSDSDGNLKGVTSIEPLGIHPKALAAALSREIEDFYHRKFGESIDNELRKIDPTEESFYEAMDIMLSKLPFLFNSELAGFFPIDSKEESGPFNNCCRKSATQNVKHLEPSCCAWGFWKNGQTENVWKSIDEVCGQRKRKCGISLDSEKCIWESLFEQGKNIILKNQAKGTHKKDESLNREGKYFDHIGCDFEIKPIGELSGQLDEYLGKIANNINIDLRQSYEGIVYDKENEGKKRKVIIQWIIKPNLMKGHEYYCLWSSLDIRPDVLHYVMRTIEEKIRDANQSIGSFMHLVEEKLATLEKRRAIEQYAAVAHLQGIERETKALLEKVDDIRGMAFRIRRQISPASAGIFAAQPDLRMLFTPNKMVLYIEGRGELQGIGVPAEEALFREAINKRRNSIPENWPEDDKWPAPEAILVLTEDRGLVSKGIKFKTVHSETDVPGNIDNVWENLAKVLYLVGLNRDLTFLREVAILSQQLSSDREKRKLFTFLKLIIHRSHSPYSIAIKNGGRRNLIYDAQFYGAILEAITLRNRNLTVRYSAQTGKAKDLKSYHDILRYIVKENILIPEDDFTERRYNDILWKNMGIIPFELRPVNILEAFARIIGVELADQPSKNEMEPRCISRMVEFDATKLEELRIWIHCKNRLPVEELHLGQDAEDHGLSGAIKILARSTNCIMPVVLDFEEIKNSSAPFAIGLSNGETKFLLRYERKKCYLSDGRGVKKDMTTSSEEEVSL